MSEKSLACVAIEPAETPPADGDATPEPPRRMYDEPEFSPFIQAGPEDYIVDAGCVYKLKSDRRVLVCQFVPEMVSERIVDHDVDRPGADRSHEVTVQFSTVNGDESVVDIALPKGKGLSGSILDALPSGVARLGVAIPSEVPLVVSALRAPMLISTTTYGQTGWLPDSNFGFPGSENVTLERISSAAGVPLLRVPTSADLARVRAGVAVLAQIIGCAPISVSLLLVASIVAGPIHRRSDHLGARGFGVLLAGPSQKGKTTLVSRVYSLLGAFAQNPMSVTTWRSTLPTIEALLHQLRDLTVFIDNFRASDGDARRVFSQIVLALGDGAARDRSSWTKDGIRIPPGLKPNALLLATGEHGFDDDAAVGGRLIELVAEDIDVRALLKLPPGCLEHLPHVFSAFVSYLKGCTAEYWAARRADLRSASELLSSHASARPSEHLATLVVSLTCFTDFVGLYAPDEASKWVDACAALEKELPDIARTQASRVFDEQVDQIVLNEVARGLRQREVHLEPLPAAGQRAPQGRLLGAFDEDAILLIPDVLTKWANEQLGSRHKNIGRKELGSALSFGAPGVELPQRTFGGARHRVWRVPRASLGSAWFGLLEEIPPRG